MVLLSLLLTIFATLLTVFVMRFLKKMANLWYLGTDGFGRSDSRANLRSFFEVDRYHVVVAALNALANQGVIEKKNRSSGYRQIRH